MTLTEARTLASINERAKTLFTAQGYTYEPMEGTADTFYVRKPGDPIWVWYLVTIGAHPHCQCPAFAHWRTCKHVLALTFEQACDEALCRNWEALRAEGEHPVWGCDPDARY